MLQREKSSGSEMLPAFWAEKQQLPHLNVPLQAVPECRQGAGSVLVKLARCSESAEQCRGHTCHPALKFGRLTHQLCTQHAAGKVLRSPAPPQSSSDVKLSHGCS